MLAAFGKLFLIVAAAIAISSPARCVRSYVTSINLYSVPAFRIDSGKGGLAYQVGGADHYFLELTLVSPQSSRSALLPVCRSRPPCLFLWPVAMRAAP